MKVIQKFRLTFRKTKRIMKNTAVYSLTLLLGISMLLGSCSRDNSVVSSRGIQKRKYQSGYHFELNRKTKSIDQNEQSEKNEVAVLEEEKDNRYNIIETNVVQNEELNTYASTDDHTVLAEATLESQVIPADTRISEWVKNTSDETEIKGDVFSKRTAKEIKKILRNEKKAEKNSNDSKAQRIDSIVYILLCIFLPPVAVGLATNWDVPMTLISLLLTLLFWLPGIIFAFYICDKEGVI